ncbi:MAG: hypothetical protein K6G61_12595 [Solobacterium sp.]|nr:hypothetical protein [Solobacterium sp.]
MIRQSKRFAASLLALALLSGCSGTGAALVKEDAYTSDSKAGNHVYTDVVSVMPVYGIYEKTDKVQINKDYTDVVAECYTADGTILYICIPVDDYQKDIDPELDLSSVIVSSVMGDYNTMYYSPARRIHGQLRESSKITDDLADTAGELTLVYSSIDEEGTPDSENAAAFTQDCAGGDYAYADIVGIMPAYTLSANNLGGYSGFICYAEDPDGNELWIHISLSDYKENFDGNVKSSDYDIAGSTDPVYFDEPLRIRGGVIFAESVSDGLADETQPKVLNFRSADK